MRKLTIFVVLSVIMLFGVLGVVSAETLNVGEGQTYTTIQSAIDAAIAGDTINVGAGTYELALSNNRYLLNINKNNLVVQAAEGEHPIILASPESFTSIKRIIEISGNGVTFKGFEVVGNGKNDLKNYDGSYLAIRIEGYGATVENNIVRDSLTGIQTTSINPTQVNNILNNKISNVAVGISLQNDGNIVKNNEISAINEGFGLASYNTQFENNKIIVSDGGYEAKISYSANGVYTGSIQDGINSVNEGDIVYVSPGLYEERITINKPLTLRGATYGINKNGYEVPENYAWNENIESIINNPDPALSTSNVVDIVSDDVVFEGFVVQSLNALTGSANDHLLRLDASTGTANDGLVEDETLDNITIRNNIIGPNTNVDSQTGTSGRMGLYFASPTYPNDEKGITNTLVTGNKIIDVLGNGNNIFVWGAAKSYNSLQNADYTGTIIEDNEISGSHRSGIEIAGGVSNLTIRNNWIHNQSSTNGGSEDSNLKYGNGILFIRMSSDKTYADAMGSENILVEKNLIENNEKNAIYFGPFNKDIIIQDNKITNNGLDAVKIDLTEVYHLGNTNVFDKVSNIVVKNNNLINSLVSVIGTPTNGFILKAKNNYWGSSSPDFTTLVSENVDYSPWYNDEEMKSLSLGAPVKDEETNEMTVELTEKLDLNTEIIIEGVTKTIEVAIPAGVNISSSDLNWNGTLNPPEIIETPAISLSQVEGNTLSLGKVIAVGLSGVSLTFDLPVKIVIPGETGKKVAYSKDGVNLVSIPACTVDNNESNLLEGGDCYYDDETDTTIWTRHFTEFLTYTQNPTERSGGSGSGGGGGGGGGSIVKSTSSTENTTTTSPLINNNESAEESPGQETTSGNSPLTAGVIFGAVGDFVKSTKGIIVLVFITAVGVTAVGVKLVKSKKSKVKKEDFGFN